MNNSIIEVHNVSIRFNLSQEKVDSIKEYFIKIVKKQLMFQEFFALQNVSFNVKRGEVFGIVGLNGSGKSTMLKTICGIYKPFKGKVVVNGSIAPLIELGAGFDMELTARENIYLNAYVLGLSKKFIDEKFNDIVDFAELWDFLDVPLKNYSSGMVARIGFAIATITDPEILIADEVLSVGDFLFQEKCEKRIKQMKDNGATILLVSHSIDQVERMCDRAVWLEKGKVKMVGDVNSVCRQYRHRNEAANRYNEWLNKVTDETLQNELNQMSEDSELIYQSFGDYLSFGTAGLRGIIGAGTNCLNIYTVGKATQGIANYLNELYKDENIISVAIAYDSRKNSLLFAQGAAAVFVANNIKVYMYHELMPTPMLSYAVRKLGCKAGIIITASHNPSNYNGYKVYDYTGCQITEKMAIAITEAIGNVNIWNQVNRLDLDSAKNKGLLEIIDNSVIDSYFNEVLARRILPDEDNSNLVVTYSALNGAGNKPVKRIMESIGICNINIVKEQENPDENFSTCPYPNPETAEALNLGIELCKKTSSDLLLATDPDCDRVGVAVMHNGDCVILTGNQIGILLLNFICHVMKLPQNPVAVKSVVSSEMARSIAEANGVEMRDVLTGFKYIGEQIALLEQSGQSNRFIFGFEESCGYLNGVYARDKDGVDASMLICEMTSYYKKQGKTLIDVLDDLYEEYGYYYDKVDSERFSVGSGMEIMDKIMQSLRKVLPNSFAGISIKATNDYFLLERHENGIISTITLPQSNMISYEMTEGSKITIRPSGTEPKLKIYYSLKCANQNEAKDKLRKFQTAIKELFEVE